LAQRVIDLIGPDKGLSVEVLGSFEGSDRNSSREIYNRYCDTSRAEKELGFNAKITIDEGILRIANQAVIFSDWP